MCLREVRFRQELLKSAMPDCLLRDLQRICCAYVVDEYQDFERFLLYAAWNHFDSNVLDDEITDPSERMIRDLPKMQHPFVKRSFSAMQESYPFRNVPKRKRLKKQLESTFWSPIDRTVDICQRILCLANEECSCSDPVLVSKETQLYASIDPESTTQTYRTEVPF